MKIKEFLNKASKVKSKFHSPLNSQSKMSYKSDNPLKKILSQKK